MQAGLSRRLGTGSTESQAKDGATTVWGISLTIARAACGGCGHIEPPLARLKIIGRAECFQPQMEQADGAVREIALSGGYSSTTATTRIQLASGLPMCGPLLIIRTTAADGGRELSELQNSWARS